MGFFVKVLVWWGVNKWKWVVFLSKIWCFIPLQFGSGEYISYITINLKIIFQKYTANDNMSISSKLYLHRLFFELFNKPKLLMRIIIWDRS